MELVEFNKHSLSPRILVAPLDWGLGHATRCIPIIKELITHGSEVYIAADKSILYLLKKEFPSSVFLRCKGYEIKYGRSKRSFFSAILSQFPRILHTVFRENQWLKNTVKKYKIDAVISDNRFGMYHKRIPSIYITHQLQIKTGNAFTDFLAKKIHHFFINKYSICWVPDEKEDGIAGELSHPKNIPPNVEYIGILSRFHAIPSEKIYDLLITISGPEPQRSNFEKEILKQLKNFSGSVLLARGLPDSNDLLTSENPLVKIVNHLTAAELNKSLEQAKMIIGRSGYTTIMDLVALNKKSILIPTPGQPEQEYLAEYLFKKSYFFCVDEENFSIADSSEKAGRFGFKDIQTPSGKYKQNVSNLILSLMKNGN